MKRFVLTIAIFFLFSITSFAAHITGGEMFYTLTSQSGNSYTYRVTLKLYRDCFCGNCAPLDAAAAIAVYDNSSGVMVWTQSITRTQTVTLNLGSPSPCILNPPVVCYEVGYYEFDVTLLAAARGYTIAYQRCCRINGINNLTNSGGEGATYIADIPGTGGLASAPANNSARFIGADTVIVCADNPFSYNFAAQDADGDQLVYSFCSAYIGGGQNNTPPNGPNSPMPIPPVGPPYTSVSYSNPPFNDLNPLGTAVSINPATGLISGIAPTSGIYVVTVCVSEIRNGIVIAIQRKDLQIKVGDCNPLRAQLNTRPTTCDGFLVNFANDVSSPPGTTFHWTFGDPASGSRDTSFLELSSHDYTLSGAGTYNVRLRVSFAGLCIDSTDLVLNVFPGFFPGFRATGSCVTNPFQFNDTTKTNYGVVDTWSWNFGDETTLADTSHVQHPQWTYSTPGTKTVTLTVTNSKGCINTVSFPVDVLDKPIITLAFRDSLICRTDALQLNASGTGVFNWTPLTNIINSNTGTPIVTPPITTWYHVNLNENGCVNRDSVLVRVVNGVSLIAMPDTTICLTDAVQLNANTNGLAFQWTPAVTLNNPNIINPIATPTAASTPYQVRAIIGSCSSIDEVIITTVPYPVADAGPNQIVCYNSSTQLNASHNGNSFTWSPVSYLSNPTILNPIASPPRTTSYVLTVFDNAGCPKPGSDTIVVTMLPRVRAYAGRDTVVVVGQPLQLNGTGGVNYLWSPSTGLSSTNIANPIGVYNSSIDTVRYKLIVTDVAGCADSAFVTVRVFKTNPAIFVPTAFTPNNDGLNDVVRPISVGIEKINYFRIYNRWGQLVFTTSADRAGWDGRIAGRAQDSGVYVWMVSAVDFTGKPYFLKGTVALIR